jgi:hypothetical protein
MWMEAYLTRYCGLNVKKLNSNTGRIIASGAMMTRLQVDRSFSNNVLGCYEMTVVFGDRLTAVVERIQVSVGAVDEVSAIEEVGAAQLEVEFNR